MSHSPESWTTTSEGDTFGQETRLVSADDIGLGRTITAEDARRIVACVNACAGVPTEELERRGQQAGDISIVCDMLRVIADFYEGGGLANIPHGCIVTPSIRFEIAGMLQCGHSVRPFSRQYYIDDAKALLEYHGFTVDEPKGTA